jgi:hypothetical protein
MIVTGCSCGEAALAEGAAEATAADGGAADAGGFLKGDATAAARGAGAGAGWAVPHPASVARIATTGNAEQG